MGLLTTGGEPLQWGSEANTIAIPKVIAHGIQQFLHVYKVKQAIDNYPFMWGEEIESLLVHVENGVVRLALDAASTLERLQKRDGDKATWHPEYGSFMVESTPAEAYTMKKESLLSIESNMRARYEAIDTETADGTFGLTLVTFPLMGVGEFTTLSEKSSPYSQSLFVPDTCINQSHPRFRTLTQNIRLRRGRKVCIQIPLYMDVNTYEKSVDKRLNIDANPRNKEINCAVIEQKRKKTARFGLKVHNANKSQITSLISTLQSTNDKSSVKTEELLYFYAQYFVNNQREHVQERYNSCPCPVPWVNHPCIYMDCMAFGMGCNCLQVTMQLRNECEARHVYDQLAVLAPVFLALSSATPFQKGLLCDSDVRWITIAAAVDDRKPEETEKVVKSRYDSISTFISCDALNLEQFNDTPIEINKDCYELLRSSNIDDRLAKHISYLFIRDPLTIFDRMIDTDDSATTVHFENIQSSNWQSVRFKPPPSADSNIGWRVEFRVMEVLPTPFENAAFATFIPLLTNAIIKYKTIFYSKLSIVDENIGRAHKINPCEELYTMRKNVFCTNYTSSVEETTEMSIDEIFNGRTDGFVGLIPLVRQYIKDEKLECVQLESYLRLLSMRAAGTIPTTAQYLRRFIVQHPDYKKDSRVTEKIAYDLSLHIHKLAKGVITDNSYLPMHAFCAHKRCREEQQLEHLLERELLTEEQESKELQETNRAKKQVVQCTKEFCENNKSYIKCPQEEYSERTTEHASFVLQDNFLKIGSCP